MSTQDLKKLFDLIYTFSYRVLNTPGQMSNFVRQRGFLDPNRLLHAPQFSYGVSIICFLTILDLKI